jgi:hypothetical protein
MPKSKNVSRKSKISQRNNMSPATRKLVYSRCPSGAGTEIVASDYEQVQRLWGQSLPRPPADWVNAVHWFTTSYEAILIPLTTPTEANFAITASSFTALAQQLIQSFDQYCIEEVAVTFVASPTNNITLVQSVPLFTAIDYDNVTNNGLPFLLGLGSSAICNLTPTTTVVRWFQPAIAAELLSTVPSAVAAGVQRSWIDSAFLNIPHNGLRTILDQSFANLRISVIFTVMVGCRNST